MNGLVQFIGVDLTAFGHEWTSSALHSSDVRPVFGTGTIRETPPRRPIRSAIHPTSVVCSGGDRIGFKPTLAGVPLFDGAFTSSDGVRGHLGWLGSNAEIAIAKGVRGSSHRPGCTLNRSFLRSTGAGSVLAALRPELLAQTSGSPDSRPSYRAVSDDQELN